MTKWQRFGEDTWVNVDQLEVLRIDEQDDGRWQLTAAFASGRTYPVGCHDDRQLLADCTDALIRGQVGEHLRAWAGDGSAGAAVEAAGPTSPARAGWWPFRRYRRDDGTGSVGTRPAVIPS